MGYLKEIKTEF